MIFSFGPSPVLHWGGVVLLAGGVALAIGSAVGDWRLGRWLGGRAGTKLRRRAVTVLICALVVAGFGPSIVAESYEEFVRAEVTREEVSLHFVWPKKPRTVLRREISGVFVESKRIRYWTEYRVRIETSASPEFSSWTADLPLAESFQRSAQSR